MPLQKSNSLWLLYALSMLACCLHLDAHNEPLKVTNAPPEKLLGYNPNTDHIVPAPNERAIALICAHGFGDRKHRFGFENTQNTTIVAFHFRDSRDRQHSWGDINLGQEADARVVLYHIILCYEAGYKTIALFGHSRGAAACITALDMVERPDAYRATWEAFGFVAHTVTTTQKSTRHLINRPAIKEIREALQRGTIFLARPLMSVDAAIGCSVANTLPCALSFLYPPAHWAATKAFACCTSYNAARAEPIDLLESLIGGNTHYKFTIYLATDDGEVSNKCDARLFDLAIQFPENLILHQIATATLVNAYQQSPGPKPARLEALFIKNPAKAAHIFIPDAISAAQEYLAGIH
jgi:hypothetical protein